MGIFKFGSRVISVIQTSDGSRVGHYECFDWSKYRLIENAGKNSNTFVDTVQSNVNTGVTLSLNIIILSMDII